MARPARAKCAILLGHSFLSKDLEVGMSDIWRKLAAVGLCSCMLFVAAGCDENAGPLGGAPSGTSSMLSVSAAPETQESLSAPTASPAPGGAAPSASAETGTDEYDHDAVLAAWETQDPSSLTGQNLAVYEKAQQVLDEIIASDMSDYDKELAVHNYMTDNIGYDETALGRTEADAGAPTSATPYGALVLNTAICYGYSSTFQLLMDMLGIECLTVDGTIEDTDRAHSWNMVNLEDNWYHVDVTWDDPVGAVPLLAYFNRPSDDFSMTFFNRKWDKSAYPEALGGPYEGPAS